MLEQHVSNWQGRILGPYQFSHLLGRGGMGEVWLAVDQRDQRQLAIKLLPGMLANEYDYQRMFRHEARVAASLKHPHILPIYDFGEIAVQEDEIISYLVMPYIPGGTLRDRLSTSNGRLPVAEGLQYLRQAAEAIDYIHSQQVLHRDIKPANMLLQDGQLLLADFGIARLLSSDTHRSRTNAGAGTPTYMAPEQIQYRAEAASDRYSLGVIAYQILTGSLPFTGDDPYDILLKQVQEQPSAPRRLNPDLPIRVEDVLLKALSKEPTERYPSCLALISALEEAWQPQSTFETVSPTQDPSDRVEKTINYVNSARPQPDVLPPRPPRSENPVALETPQFPEDSDSPESPGSSEQIMAPMILKNQTAADTPTEQQAKQEQQTGIASARKRGPGRRAVLIGGAGILLLAAGGTTAVALLKNAMAPEPIPPGPQQFTPGKPLMILTGNKDVIENVVWDPTGRYLATAGADTHVMLWDIGNALKHFTSVQMLNQPTRKWKFAYDIQGNYLHWTLDGRRLIVSDNSVGAFTLLDPFATQSYRQTFTNKNSSAQDLFTHYMCVIPQPHSTTLAAIVFNNPGQIEVNLWQIAKPDLPFARLTCTPPKSKTSSQARLTAIAWSDDGTLLAGQLTTQQLVIWNALTRKVQSIISIPPRKGHGEVNITKVPFAWSPTDPDIVAAFNIDTIAIINIRQGKVLYQLSTDDKDALTPPPKSDVPWYQHIISLTWSPNGRYIAGSYSRSARIHVWDLQAHTYKTGPNGERLQQYLVPEVGKPPIHTNTIFDLAWSPDGRYLATSSYDLSTIIWQVDA